jgi:hypothetical protein
MENRSRGTGQRKALAITGQLERPEEIPARLWPVIHSLLTEIARHYPHSFPGQQTLAQALGRSVPTIKRYLSMAVKAGLVEVTPNSGGKPYHGHWRTNSYQLRYLNRGSPVIPRPGITGEPQTSTPYGVDEKRRKEVAIPAESLEGTPMAWEKKRSPDDPAGWGDPYGADPDPELPATVVQIDPAVRLSRHFDDRWRTKVLPRRPELRGHQPSQRQRAAGYIRSAMLGSAGLSPAHVERYIDTFMVAVINEEVDWHEGQLPFQRFTSWWGHNFVEDPAIREAQLAEGRAVMAEYDRMMGRTP